MSPRIATAAEAGAFERALIDGDVPKVQAVLTKVVLDSFAPNAHPMRYPTRNEINRRKDIVLKWFEQLRGDLKYPVDRALSSVRRALACELDGRTYEPSASVLYAVDEDLEPVTRLIRADPVMLGPQAARLN